MADNIQGVTEHVAFFSCNPAQTNLFSVCPGVPATDALNMASSFLDVARDAAYGATDDGSGNSGCAAAYLIAMAKAVIDAVIIPSPGSASGSRFAGVIERINLLCDDQALIVNPDATEPAAIDALSFLSWVRQQKNGGAQ